MKKILIYHTEQPDATRVSRPPIVLPIHKKSYGGLIHTFGEGGYIYNDKTPTEESQAVKAARVKYPILNNVDFDVYSDPNYRASDYNDNGKNFGNIETFLNGMSRIKYSPDYIYPNPNGTGNAIVYNPDRINPDYTQAAINLDAVSHIGHDDATYDTLSALVGAEYPDAAASEMLRLYERQTGKNLMDTPADKRPYKKEWIPQVLEAWDDAPKRYQNAVDGVIRQYIANKDYPNSYKAMGYAPYNASWDAGNNSPFYLEQLYDYVTTGQKPPNVLSEVTVTGNKHSDGGSLDSPRKWNDLSLKEMSDVMAVAVKYGITSLKDIRDKWNEFAEGGNLFKYGGYAPSKAVRDRIANWEGSSMKTNRSFEAEAKDFNTVIPQAVRDNLSQEQLDALYSYGYNVGMGNLKKRVLPTLQNYINGKAGAEDVASSMWASRDKDLRGLQRRRAYEKSQFVYGSPSDRRQSVVDAALNMDLSPLPSGNGTTLQQQVLPPNPTDYGTPVDYSSIIRKPVTQEDVVPERDNGIGLFSLMRNLGVFGKQQQQPLADYKPQQRSPFVVSAPTYNDTLLDDSWFAEGGPLYGHRFDGSGSSNLIYKGDLTGNLTDKDDNQIVSIGWDADGRRLYRNSVTGDIGYSFEPDDAAVITGYTPMTRYMQTPAAKVMANDKPLEEVYPEFDLIGFGGAAKNLTEMAYDWARRKTAQKLSQKSASKAFTSELDWSPDSWFGTRVNGVYDADDVAALQSHVPEYLTIEQKAKSDGTWLKMPDGSTWEGDPRSWVQMQSQAYRDAGLTGIPHYSGIDLKTHPLSYTPEYKDDSWTDLNMGMSKNWSGIDSPAHDGYIFQLDYPSSSKVYAVNAGGKDWNDLPSKIFLEKPDIYKNSTDDLVEQSARHGYDVTRIDNVVEGFSDGRPVTDVVIHAGTPRKSLIGNNGNFDMANPNIFKGLVYPFGIGWTINNFTSKDK